MACVRSCGFLDRHGTPKRLAQEYDPEIRAKAPVPYECSLCGLCGAICPSGVEPAEMLLEMRREVVERGREGLVEHRRIRAYERKGTSKRYSYYALPPGCDTVFFPGCTFSGTRSDKVLKLQAQLEEAIPNLGIVLDCCTKPSHDLGREAYFGAMFGEMRDYLLAQGVRRVLVACPSCHKVFRRYGGGLETLTIYEVLNRGRNGAPVAGTVTIHDPCVVRLEKHVQASARDLVKGLGLSTAEMEHSGTSTLCCGEGGAVGSVDRDLASRWAARRKAEVDGRRVVTYCAGCAQSLGRHTPTIHLVDLLFEPEVALAGRTRVAKAPLTYWNRLRLKRRLKKRFRGAVTRERTFSAGDGREGPDRTVA